MRIRTEFMLACVVPILVALVCIVPTTGSAAEPSGDGTAVQTYPTEIVELTLEAEAATLESPMTVQSDPTASGGKYAWVPLGSGDSRGTATFHFQIPKSGKYAIWARISKLAEGSMLVSVDGGPSIRWDTNPRPATSDWRWLRVFWTEHSDLVFYDLTAGAHTVKFGSREQTVRLDQIVVSNDLFSAPGEPRYTAPRTVVKIWKEAEDLELVSPMAISSDPSASGGRCISASAAGGSARFAFDITEPGAYIIWGRMRSVRGGDSFWFSHDGGMREYYGVHGAQGGWKWMPVNLFWNDRYPLVLNLAAGRHTIEYAGREPGQRLDRVLVTNDFYDWPSGLSAFRVGESTLAVQPGSLSGPVKINLEVKANGISLRDKPAEISLNFTQLLAAAGRPGAFDKSSLRVEEVSTMGEIVRATVPFQFDEGSGYSASTNAAGTLVFILEDDMGATATRYYRVSFDRTGAGYGPVSITPQVILTDDVMDEEQMSYRIQTRNATYFYHKQGAGFSSIVDLAGNDWVSYRKIEDCPGGRCRGLPNLAGQFHPGYAHGDDRPGEASNSTIVSRGPIKVKVRSVTVDNQWECTWEFYPHYARMTLVRKPADMPYYFLYEGTPGGSFDAENDFWVRSNGQRGPLRETQEGDIPNPEWVYWEDSAAKQVFFMAHHEDDTLTDRYWGMQEKMVVFGFGRGGRNDKLMTAVPQHFTIGFAETKDFAAVSATIASAYRDVVVTLVRDGRR